MTGTRPVRMAGSSATMATVVNIGSTHNARRPVRDLRQSSTANAAPTAAAASIEGIA